MVLHLCHGNPTPKRLPRIGRERRKKPSTRERKAPTTQLAKKASTPKKDEPSALPLEPEIRIDLMCIDGDRESSTHAPLREFACIDSRGWTWWLLRQQIPWEQQTYIGEYLLKTGRDQDLDLDLSLWR